MNRQLQWTGTALAAISVFLGVFVMVLARSTESANGSMHIAVIPEATLIAGALACIYGQSHGAGEATSDGFRLRRRLVTLLRRMAVITLVVVVMATVALALVLPALATVLVGLISAQGALALWAAAGYLAP